MVACLLELLLFGHPSYRTLRLVDRAVDAVDSFVVLSHVGLVLTLVDHDAAEHHIELLVILRDIWCIDARVILLAEGRLLELLRAYLGHVQISLVM